MPDNRNEDGQEKFTKLLQKQDELKWQPQAESDTNAPHESGSKQILLSLISCFSYRLYIKAICSSKFLLWGVGKSLSRR